MIRKQEIKFKDGKRLYNVSFKNYICPCGTENCPLPKDEKCTNCKYSLI